MKNKLRIIQYTDPICIWCLALEPALRKIEFLAPEQVEFHNVLGLLVGNVEQIIGNDKFSAMRFTNLKKQMIDHFNDATLKSGMPISTEHMNTVLPEDVTSVPASTAFQAMKLIDEHTANRYMRRIREAFHSDDISVSNFDALIELASEFEIDIEEFKNNLTNGAAEEALNRDISQCHAAGIRAFPTVLLEYGDRKKIIRGFVEYSSLKMEIERLTNGEVQLKEKKMTMELLTEYISKFKRVAAREIQVAFSLSDKELQDTVQELLDSNLFEKLERGSGYFIQGRSLVTCDSSTGTCSF